MDPEIVVLLSEILFTRSTSQYETLKNCQYCCASQYHEIVEYCEHGK